MSKEYTEAVWVKSAQFFYVRYGSIGIWILGTGGRKSVIERMHSLNLKQTRTVYATCTYNKVNFDDNVDLTSELYFYF